MPDTIAHAAIDALNERAWALRFSDTPEGLRLAGEALLAAREAGYPRGEAYALRNAGWCRCAMNQNDAALADLDAAGRLLSQLGDDSGWASVFNCVGRVHLRRADFPAALQAHSAALRLQRAAGDRAGEGDTHNFLGTVYFSLSDLPRALEQFHASLELKEAQGDRLGVSHALNNIGGIHGNMRQFAVALEYHLRTLELKREVGDRLGEAIALINVGNSYSQMGEHGLALEHFHAGLSKTYESGDMITRATAFSDLGDLHRARGDLPVAMDFYRQAVAVSREAGNAYLEAEARIGLGQALAAAGDRAAPAELHAALSLAQRLEAPRFVYEAHLALSAAYEAAGDAAQALQHFRAYHRVEDEVHGAEAERRIHALLAQAEIERSHREAELLRARNDALAAANEEKARLLDTLRAQAAELERLTREDALTGVFNRRHLDALLELEWERARRFGRHLSLVMVDVDHFKAVNDGWSHAVGDEVLRRIATVLREGTRVVDSVGRLGGEEFLLLLVETAPEHARSLCEKLRAAIEGHDWPSIAGGLRVTASFGIAGNDAADNPGALLSAADARLYAAKRAGRNRVVAG